MAAPRVFIPPAVAFAQGRSIPFARFLGNRSLNSTHKLQLAQPVRCFSGTTPDPIALFVTVEIEESRVPAFLEAMAVDVSGSRKEEGCHRFDLLRDQSDPNKFSFYEVYKDADAIDLHKTFDHYKAWADFKAEGGVISQTVLKADAIDFTF